MVRLLGAWGCGMGNKRGDFKAIYITKTWERTRKMWLCRITFLGWKGSLLVMEPKVLYFIPCIKYDRHCWFWQASWAFFSSLSLQRAQGNDAVSRWSEGGLERLLLSVPEALARREKADALGTFVSLHSPFLVGVSSTGDCGIQNITVQPAQDTGKQKNRHKECIELFISGLQSLSQPASCLNWEITNQVKSFLFWSLLSSWLEWFVIEQNYCNQIVLLLWFYFITWLWTSLHLTLRKVSMTGDFETFKGTLRWYLLAILVGRFCMLKDMGEPSDCLLLCSWIDVLLRRLQRMSVVGGTDGGILGPAAHASCWQMMT